VALLVERVRLFVLDVHVPGRDGVSDGDVGARLPEYTTFWHCGSLARFRWIHGVFKMAMWQPCPVHSGSLDPEGEHSRVREQNPLPCIRIQDAEVRHIYGQRRAMIIAGTG